MDIMAPLLSSKIGDSEYQTKAVDEKVSISIAQEASLTFSFALYNLLFA